MTKKNILIGAAAAVALVGGGVAIAQTADKDGHKGKRGGRGDMVAMMDTNKDGNLTRDEFVQATTQHFQKMDVNKDGKLDQADRDAMREQHQAARFDKYDANDDGSISKTEFAAPGDRLDMADGAPPPDGPRDGMRRGGKRGGKGGFGRGGGMFGDADANGDKVVTAEEFQTASLARFDKMDANKDGTATKAEMEAARNAMKAERKAKRDVQKNNSAN